MAGKTEAGPGAAEATLFEGARWVVLRRARRRRSHRVDPSASARTLGATPQFIGPEEHDAYVAAISHLPLMAATALFRLARSPRHGRRCRCSRPAVSRTPPGSRAQTLQWRTTSPSRIDKQIAHWLQRYREALQTLENEILDIEHESELFRALSEANLQYSAFSQGIVGARKSTRTWSQTSPRAAA